jgi:phage-related tail fiber protein
MATYEGIKAVTTVTRRRKLAEAERTGTIPPITHMAWGDGGHDPVTGEPLDADDEALTVMGEHTKVPIDSIEVSENVVTVTAVLDRSNAVGKTISSVGLYDSDGDLVAIRNKVPVVKDDDTWIEDIWTEVF